MHSLQYSCRVLGPRHLFRRPALHRHLYRHLRHLYRHLRHLSWQQCQLQ